MKLQNHINKVSWALLDKVIFIVYGIVNLKQIGMMELQDFGLFSILLAINTYIFILTDSISLNNIIQFRANKDSIGKVNLLSLILHFCIVMGLSLALYLFREPFAYLFHDKRIMEVGVSLPILSLLMIPRTYCSKFMMAELDWKKMFFTDLAFFGPMVMFIVYFVINHWGMSYQQAVQIYFLGVGLSSLVAIVLTRSHLVFNLMGEIGLKRMMQFSIPFTFTTTLHTLPKYLDVIIIQYMFKSTSVVAVYQAAKNLFRIFDEGLNAANGLIYPATVKMIERGDLHNLKETLSKAISFILMTFIIGFIILNLGVIELVVKLFLSSKYLIAIPQFKLMLLAIFTMPFTILFFVITAFHKQKDLLKMVSIASALSIATFFVVGYFQVNELIPLGIVVYSVSLSMMTLYYANRKLNLKFTFGDIFRAIRDSVNFIKNNVVKKNKSV